MDFSTGKKELRVSMHLDFPVGWRAKEARLAITVIFCCRV
jgi:hypothetical protein